MIEVKDVWKKFKYYEKPADRLKEIFLFKKFHKEHWALRGVSFSLEKGETLGIIGPNGAGKSTLLKILTGVMLPDKGRIKKSGKIVGILELGTGFNWELSGYENIYLNGLMLGLSKKEIDSIVRDVIEFSELGDYIYNPLKTYSSGMVMRLAFSIAVHTNPECLIIDEALSVGDIYFQQKSFRKLKELKEKGVSIIFVSHDLNAVKLLCDKALLLHKGKVVEEGDPDSVVKAYYKLLSVIAKEGNQFSLTTSEGNSAYGNKRAVIESVNVLGESSGTNVVRSGEWMRLILKIKSYDDIDQVTIGFLIRDRFGQDIYGVNTYLLEEPVKLRKGEEYTAEFRFQANLAPGKYTVTVALHKGKAHTEECFYWKDDATHFEVAGFSKHEFAGVAYLPTEFFLKSNR